MTTSHRRCRIYTRRLGFEALEERSMLAVTLDLGSRVALAPRLDTAGLPINVNVSNEPTSHQSEMTLDVNPKNPLQLAGFSHNVANLDHSQIDVFRSSDGGTTWYRQTINTVDKNLGDLDLGTASGRFDPSIAFDADGDDDHVVDNDDLEVLNEHFNNTFDLEDVLFS